MYYVTYSLLIYLLSAKYWLYRLWCN